MPTQRVLLYSYIRQVFDEHGVKTALHPNGEISVRNLESALLELGASGNSHSVFVDMDGNSDEVVDYEEFKAVLRTASPVEAWAKPPKRLPWWQAVADAMPVPDAAGEDPLRAVAGLSEEQMDAACRVVAEETPRVPRSFVG